MLYRTRPKRNFSRAAWRAGDILLGAGGLFCLYMAAAGALNGEIEILSKRVSGTVSLAADPLWFIGMSVAWVSGGIFLLRLAISHWREQ